MKRSFSINLSLFIVLLIWANSYVMIKIATKELTPLSIVASRFLIIFPFLFLFPSLYKIKNLKKEDILKILILSFLNVPGYHLSINKAETLINASTASLISGLNPILTTFFSSIFLKEKVTFKKGFGLFISFSGVIILTYGISYGFKIENFVGAFFSLLSVLSWVTSTIISKPLFKKYDPLDTTIWIIFIGTLMIFPFIRESNITEILNMSKITLFAIFYLGFLAILFGYIFWYKGLKYKEASVASSFIYLNPIIGTISGLVFLKEKLSTLSLIGGLFIILGLFLVNPLKMEKD
ncbi:MAG: DMT family transporter [Caldisericia bacterium]|jgi:drug/metabolite transporter (DMT)-like permease|nr:DMT family transporter [Caldisericia bacterium]